MINENNTAPATESTNTTTERKAWETPAMQMLHASSTEFNPIFTNDTEGTAS